MEGEKKRINCVAKGNRRQNACRKKLESEGWTCYVARRGWKGVQIDIFGLWDIIAWREGFLKFVQVKSNACKGVQKLALQKFCVDGHFVHKELWIYHDHSRSGPEIIDIYGPPEENEPPYPEIL